MPTVEPATDPVDCRLHYSFEVFPARTRAAALALGHTVQLLADTAPDFISVTYGASGSTRDASLDLLRYIREHTLARPLGHLTCVGVSRAELVHEIGQFFDTGIVDFLALRGDDPKDSVRVAADASDALNSAAELIALIAEVHAERRGEPRDARVGVAAFPSGNPALGSRRADIDTLLTKQAAGATFAITQLFFDADEYMTFVADARESGVTIPIIPGIMPVISAQQLQRIAGLVGRRPPGELVRAMEYGDRDPRAVGIDHALQLARAVLDGGAPSIHLYTFNKHRSALRVLEELGAPISSQRRTPS